MVVCGFCLTLGVAVGFFFACLGVAAGLRDRVYIERDRIPGRLEYPGDVEGSDDLNMYALGWNDYRDKLLGYPEEEEDAEALGLYRNREGGES